jgi:hypothetical protein
MHVRDIFGVFLSLPRAAAHPARGADLPLE